MNDIIVNSHRSKAQCRFHSIQEMIDYNISSRFGRGIVYSLKEIVQCNIPYRNFLRENGYSALIEKLKSEAPYIDEHPEVLDSLERWWRMVEKHGGLGDYDIQCYELRDRITIFGEQIRGWKGVEDIRQVSEQYWKVKEKIADKVFVNERKNKRSSLYAAELYDRYPIFDSSDALCEDRYYRCFFIRNQRIDNNFFAEFDGFPISDPITEDRRLSELPMVFRDGHDPVMYLINSGRY